MAHRAKPTPRLLPMLSRRILLDKMVKPRKMELSSCRVCQLVRDEWGQKWPYDFSETLGEVGDVEVGGVIVPFGLEA